MTSLQRRVVFGRESVAQLDEQHDFVAAAGAPVAAAELHGVVVDNNTPAVAFTALLS